MKINLTVFVFFLFSINLSAQGEYIDSSFATDGSYLLDYYGFNHVDQGRKSLIQSDGKIIIGGNVWSGVATNDDIYLTRLNIDGSLDQTFGNNGELLIDLNDYEKLANIVFTDNEDIIVYVSKGFLQGSASVLLKVNNNGTLDNSFGNNGYVDVSSLAHPSGLGIQSDGKIITTCNLGFIQTTDIQINRYNTDGSIDNTFGTNGIVTENFGGTSIVAYTLLIDHLDDIVLSASKNNSSTFITKFKANGSLDFTFSNNGVFEISNVSNSFITKISLDNPHKHYIIGFHETAPANSNYELMQIEIPGDIDTAFGNSGVLSLDFGGFDRIGDFEYDTNNNLVISGRSNDSTNYYYLLTRINSIGIIDTTFGDHGVIKVNFEHDEYSGELNIQADGKMIITGSTLPSGSNPDIFVGRINPDLLSNTISLPIKKKQISVFPNPSYGNITIQLDENINEVVLVSVFDMNGRQLIRKNLNLENGKAFLSLPKTLPTGQYIMQVVGEKITSTKKLIITKE